MVPTLETLFCSLTFSMAESFEGPRIEIGFHIAETIDHLGGKLTRKVSESQVFVWDGILDSKRLQSVNINDKEIEIISTDELFSSEYEPKIKKE